MPKTEVTPEYVDALNEFVDMLNTTFAAEGLTFLYESGRLYDKVKVADKNAPKVDGKTQTKVKFFVEREVGTIYGKKSELAPNLKWFFGDLYTTDEWMWDREYPEPKNPDNFQKVSEYGKYKHYQPLTSATADT